MSPERSVPHIYALTAAALWGLAGVVNKGLLRSFLPAHQVLIEIGFSATLTWFLLLWHREIELA
jgi:drug/metabolite transporter (DMT)-like permease